MMVRYCQTLAACVAAMCLAGCSQAVGEPDQAAGKSPTARISVELASVATADIAANVELVGSLIGQRRSIIVSEVDGVIAEIPASHRDRIEVELDGQLISHSPRLDMGIEVSQGDPLVRLDPTQYELKLQAAEARLKSAECELRNLRAWRRSEEVRRAEAARDEAACNAKLAVSDLKRAEELIDRNAIARASYDQMRAKSLSAEAALARAKADVELAKAGPTEEQIAVGFAAIEQARVDVARAQWELDKAVIRAPYDGVVTDRWVDEGDRVTAMPRVEILELVDLSILTAQLRVPERYVNQIHVGDVAEVVVKGSVDPVRGLVVLINDKVDRESRTYRIRVAVGNDDRRFKVGQFVRVALPVDGSTGTLTVPTRAVTYTGGEARVFVYHDSRVRAKHVTLGLNDGTSAEVLSGLDRGEQVVVDDPSILSDGMTVTVRTAESSARPEVEAS